MNNNRNALRSSPIELIALDLDGTTLGKNEILSDYTKKVIEDALSCGLHIVIATGRVYSSLPKELFDIEGLKYIITSNGAEIVDITTGEKIYTNYIGEASALQSLELLEAHGFEVEIFINGKAYIKEEDYIRVQTHGSKIRSSEYILTTRLPSSNIYTMAKDNLSSIENINIIFEDDNTKEKIWDVISEIKDVTLTSSLSCNYEIGGQTTSKATALSYLLKILDLREDNLMAFGDSPNDIEMLKLAAVGVAMGNGKSEVKEIATFICESNTEDGVAKTIEALLKEKHLITP